jgi:PAS domain S-box-containing protein
MNIHNNNFNIRLLLIEDNEGDIAIIKRLLNDSQGKYELDIARNLNEGFRFCNEKDYDLILSDLGLPEEQGVTTFIKLQEHISIVPIVVMTGLDDRELAVHTLKLGAQDYVVKDNLDVVALEKAIVFAIERHKLFKEISEREFRFRKTFEKSYLGFFQTSIEGKIIWCNKAFAEMFGYSNTTEIIESVHDLGSQLYPSPEDRKSIIDQLDAQSDETLIAEKSFYKKDKDLFTGRLSVRKEKYPFSDQFYLEGFIEDITSQKEAEENLQYESYINRSLANVAKELLNPDLSIENISSIVLKHAIEFTSSNNGYIGYLESEKNNFVILMFKESSMHIQIKKEGDTYAGLFGHTLNTRVGCIINNPGDFMKTNKISETFHIQNFLSVPVIANKNLIGQISLMDCEKGFVDEELDFVEKLSNLFALAILTKRINLELIHARNKAEESDKLKTAFLSNLSHEIRTPLNLIIGVAQLLGSENTEKEELLEYKQRLSKNSNILLEMINNIIFSAKIETKQIKPNINTININNTFSDIEKEFRSEIHRYYKDQVSLTKNTPDTQVIFNTDPFLLHQILKHLIDNAFKFTNEGSIEFGFSLKDEGLLIYVKDSGIGIPEEKKNIIFDPFRLVDEFKGRPTRGTGLGLPIVKSLVEMLQGEIRVESILNEGSCFYIHLPFL